MKPCIFFVPAMLMGMAPAVAADKDAPAAHVELKVTEKVLGPEPTWKEDDKPVVSPDGKHVAWTVVRTVKSYQEHCVVVDGEEGKRSYDRIYEILFSPDGKHVVYKAFRYDAGCVVVIDGVEGHGYANIEELHFSDDGSRIGYVAKRRDAEWDPKAAAVIDGIEGRWYKSVQNVTFSRDGRHVAYAALVDNLLTYVVVDGVAGKACEKIGWESLRISDDGKHTAFVEELLNPPQKGREYRVVVDGKAGDLYSRIERDWLQMSPDGRRVAYAAQRDGTWLLVVDGKENSNYDAVEPDTLQFNPDGRRLGYAACKDGKRRVVVDGIDGPECESPEFFVLHFGADGKRFAYVANYGSQYSCVTDRGEGKKYQRVDTVRISPDGKHVAYGAERDDRDWSVVVDEKEGKPYSRVYAYCFTAGGDHLVQVAEARDALNDTYRNAYVVDGGETPLPASTQPTFDALACGPDGRHTAFVAGDESDAECVVVDGVATARIGRTLDESRLVFDGPNRLCVLTRRDGKLIRTEIEIIDK